MKPTFVPLFLLAAGYGAIALAQSPGTFTATGNLTTERTFHTATLLTNGKVLIAGGFAVVVPSFAVRASAELYDPSTGTFKATGNMTTPRRNHTATLLPNGKVLIAGGHPDVNVQNSELAGAELYDPSTGTFSATANMTTARSGHTATLLNNGKVLIAGGSRNRPLDSAELYDPSTGAFTASGKMTVSQGSHTATLLSNGKVLIETSGGPDGVDSPGPNELYDPETGAFSPTAGKARSDLFPVTASLLTNGKVLITEQYSCDASPFAELYDPAAGTSTPTGSMTKERGYSTGTLLPDGKVLIAGRDWVSRPQAGSVDLYDPVTGTFSNAGVFAGREEGFTATLLPDGTVLMSGGWVCCGFSIATAGIYRPSVLVPSPVLFSLAQGQGAILHAGTSRLVSSSDPAIAGETLEIYLTGLTDGSAIPPQVAIGGRMAEVLFFGKAPGFAGVNQVNVRVPGGVTLGSAVGVRLTYLARPSNEVTIGVQ